MKNYSRFLNEKYNTTKFNRPGKSFDYVEEEETSEGNAFTKMLKNTKKGDKFSLNGKEYTDRSSLDEEPIYEIEVNDGEMCECGGQMMEGECTECGYMKESEMNEKLHGNQFKLDKNKNGKIDKSDFDLLRKSEKNMNEISDEFDYEMQEPCPHCNGTGYNEFDDVECEWCDGTGEYDEYGDLKISDDMPAYKTNWKMPEDDFNTDSSDIVYEIEIDEDMYDNAEKTTDFWNPGKKELRTKMYEYEIFNERLGRSIRLTEEQVVNLIENLAEEKMKPTKKTRGYTEYERSFKKSGDENQDYYKEVGQKMKKYAKDGSMEDFTMDAKHFPMGNGELKKMDKMAYVPSDSVAEYVENFTAAALENIDYDEFAPNEEWVKDNIVGSSRTGNNPEWGNAVETPTNKKRNEIREKNLLAQIKRKAYNKSAQPVVKDRPGNDDASDLLNKVEKGEKAVSKKSKKVNENIERIAGLITYNSKTQ